jgi:hypothetical protein
MAYLAIWPNDTMLEYRVKRRAPGLLDQGKNLVAVFRMNHREIGVETTFKTGPVDPDDAEGFVRPDEFAGAKL